MRLGVIQGQNISTRVFHHLSDLPDRTVLAAVKHFFSGLATTFPNTTAVGIDGKPWRLRRSI
jgi:hypothetical protein